ncbi:uncharacterized protein BX663DRAFT_504939 [Cokeromyces recurvatus]|uniref:uncharacterized protein n=1 Tax=Cokeromyces recurvatus TaxID=90255 RepID=UPI00221EAF19|nr:uncharacterized protein BX663DRAFT_504939 [Cokeromyces recurvatus]KAI7904402.1 hypothetical protein BX663DRAFT_504939 [Cokeromyces recurvatus]
MSANTQKIVFLIDEQSLMSNLINLEQLKLSIMRILIFYSMLVDQQQVLWGYRFFSTKVRYTTNSMRRFYTMTTDALENIDQEYKKRESERPNMIVQEPAIMRIKEVLKEAIGDFQWENGLASEQESTNNHLFIITSTPLTWSELPSFFPLNSEITQLSAFDTLAYFEELKEELADTLLESYTERQISISIIDTTFKQLQISPIEEKLANAIRSGFKSCFKLYHGTYIAFHTLLRVNDIYGHSFISEFVNILPSREFSSYVTPFIPLWRGEFKSCRGRSIGQCSLYPARRSGHYNPESLMYMAELQIISHIRAKQFSLSWLTRETNKEEENKYRMVYEDGGSFNVFNALLEELYKRQEILIGEFIPLSDFDLPRQRVCIEPYSRACASVQFIHCKEIPRYLNEDASIKNKVSPIGTFYKSIKLDTKLPNFLNSALKLPSIKFNLKMPEKIKDVIYNTFRSKQGNLGNATIDASEQPEEEEVIERIITLPSNVNKMGKDLKNLYLEALYTQNDTMDNVITIIDKWIEHLLNHKYTKEDIIATIFDYTMPVTDLDIKHSNEIPRTMHLLPSQHTVEQEYQYSWWKEIKMHPHYNYKFEKMNCIALKVKEAQLQVILYCFICRLMTDLPPDLLKRNPFFESEDFFTKIVLMFTMNDVGDFLAELDSEEGPAAVKFRDPCDLSDHAFCTLLEEKFSDLKDLTEKFKESTGADDMESITFSDDDLIDNFEIVGDSSRNKGKEKETQRPVLDRQKSSHNHNMNKSLLESSSSRLSAKSSLSRMNSNPLDSFLKRTVDVNQNLRRGPENSLGEAAREAIDKINRSLIDGRTDMMRAGSFMKSARQEETRPVVHNEDSNGVVLRRNQTNEQLTPRTSLNRFFQIDIFNEYSETCLSPTSATANEYGHIQSAYPSMHQPPPIPNEPKKSEEDMDEEEDFSFILGNSATESPPPHDIMASARRDLTSEFKSILEEEMTNKEQCSQPLKRSLDELFGSDEDENEDENPFENSLPRKKQHI